jgi:hypothetical protein
MSAPLLIHLAQNLAKLELYEYTTETGTRKALKNSGGAWLKLLVAVCNYAQEPDRCCTAGWRAITKAAGTNNDTAQYWVEEVFTQQLHWFTKRDPVRPEAGRRGKPANCYEVTLPNLPPKNLELWQEPAKQPAPVQPISEAHSKRSKRSGAPTSLGQVLGNAVAQLQPEAALPSAEVIPLPQWSKETEAVMQTARQVVLSQAVSKNLSAPQQVIAVEQAAGSWSAAYGKRKPAALQVQEALQAGTCSDTEAVRYLASGLCSRVNLDKFQRGEN